MKKLLIGAAAISLLAAGAASAQDNRDHRDAVPSSGAHMGSHDNSAARGASPSYAPSARFNGGSRDFHGDARYQGGQQFHGDQRFQGNQQFRGDQRFQGNQQFRGDQRFQGNRDDRGDQRFNGAGQFRDQRYQGGQYRDDRRYQGGQFRGDTDLRAGQLNGGRNWTHNDFRNWRGGRGPWVNDRNWFRNNWRFQSPGRYRGGYYNWPRGWNGYRNWYYGAILPSIFLNDDYILDNWWNYGLYEPPYGYEWVRVGPDVLLVDPNSGEVVQVVSDAFY